MNCPNCHVPIKSVPSTGTCIVYAEKMSSDLSYISAEFDCACGAAGTFYWDFNESAADWETIDDKCEGGEEE